jgi:hypothetical protein
MIDRLAPDDIPPLSRAGVPTRCPAAMSSAMPERVASQWATQRALATCEMTATASAAVKLRAKSGLRQSGDAAGTREAMQKNASFSEVPGRSHAAISAGQAPIWRPKELSYASRSWRGNCNTPCPHKNRHLDSTSGPGSQRMPECRQQKRSTSR